MSFNQSAITPTACEVSPELSELSKRLLASIEAHGTIPLKSFYQLFSHETHKDVDAGLTELVSSGWVKRRKSFMLDNEKINMPCVSRTRKQLYVQPEIFDPANA